MTYADYIASPAWQARREMTIALWGGRCALCYAAGALDVHHRTYDRLGHELPSDLVALCPTCHEAYHRWSAPAPRATEADRSYRRRLAIEASVDAAFVQHTTAPGAGPTAEPVPPGEANRRIQGPSPSDASLGLRTPQQRGPQSTSGAISEGGDHA